MLQASIDTPIPDRLAVGRGTAMLVAGWCFDDVAPTEELTLLLADRHVPAMSLAAPRPDQRRRFDSDLALRGGFWAIVDLPAGTATGPAELRLRARLADGRQETVAVGATEIVAEHQPPPERLEAARRLERLGGGAIAIAMATFEPEPELLARQLDSIRAQVDARWICLISDDGSSPASLSSLERAVAGDDRFIVSRSPRNRGFYANFERALEMVPAEAELVALSDQDDYWYPDKLATLRRALGDAQLAYSDARIVDPRGRVESPTYWRLRQNNFDNLASLALANTVSGGASLFRREVLELALPFPPAHGRFFHDHWIALVAAASGRLAYVDRPLYDYVQHETAAMGHERAHAWAHRPRNLGQKLGLFRTEPEFFYRHWQTTYFTEYCRIALLARVLLLRLGPRMKPRERRALAMLADADRSPRAIGWLATRRLRALAGRNETLHAEGRLLRAFLWRRMLRLGARTPGARWLPRDGSFATEPEVEASGEGAEPR